MGAVLHGGFCCKQLGTVYHGHSHGGSSSHGHSHGTGSSHGHSHGSSHGHSHGSSHGHSHSEKSQNQSTNLNVRAAFIHVIGDLVQSIGVLIAAIIIKFRVRLISTALVFKKTKKLPFSKLIHLKYLNVFKNGHFKTQFKKKYLNVKKLILFLYSPTINWPTRSALSSFPSWCWPRHSA